MPDHRTDDLNEVVSELREQLAQTEQRNASLESMLDDANRRIAEQHRIVSEVIERDVAAAAPASPPPISAAEPGSRSGRETTARFNREQLYWRYRKLEPRPRGFGAMRAAAVWASVIIASFYAGFVLVAPRFQGASRGRTGGPTPARTIAPQQGTKVARLDVPAPVHGPLPPLATTLFSRAGNPTKPVDRDAPDVELVPADGGAGISLQPTDQRAGAHHASRRKPKEERNSARVAATSDPDHAADPTTKRSQPNPPTAHASTNLRSRRPLPTAKAKQLASAELSSPLLHHPNDPAPAPEVEKTTPRPAEARRSHEPDFREPIDPGDSARRDVKTASARRERIRHPSPVQIPDDVDSRREPRDRRDREDDDPSRRITVRICVETGLRANPWCPHTAKLNVAPERAPRGTCRLHHAELDGWN